MSAELRQKLFKLYSTHEDSFDLFGDFALLYKTLNTIFKRSIVATGNNTSFKFKTKLGGGTFGLINYSLDEIAKQTKWFYEDLQKLIGQKVPALFAIHRISYLKTDANRMYGTISIITHFHCKGSKTIVMDFINEFYCFVRQIL